MAEKTESIETMAMLAKKACPTLKSLSTQTKNHVLSALKKKLLDNKNKIFAANEEDCKEGKAKGIGSALLDRLALNEKGLNNLIKSIDEIINLPDPIGEVVRGLTLPNGLQLVTKRVPIGVIMTIYESRPNVTIDVAALSFKAGNACILRGGKEAFQTNVVLSDLFKEVLKEENLPTAAVTFVSNTDREAMIPLLKLDRYIDLVVPRGGEALIRFVTENARIPVVKHDKGVTNLFVDKSARPEIVNSIVLNSKAQRPAVCNALENLILHKDYPESKELLSELQKSNVEIYVEPDYLNLLPGLKLVSEDLYSEEFLDLRLSVKFVSNLDEAIRFIETYSSGHTECILSESQESILRFQNEIDSAAIFVNCSTRFHDGGEFQLGAEVGISTGKLHVRGPMGLPHLTTTTTYLTGSGQIRG